MKCEKYKIMLMDYIYDEISNEDKKQFELHLEDCDSCKADLKAFKTTSNVLNAWEDKDPDLNLTFSSNSKSWFSDFFETFKTIKLARGLAYTFGFILIFLSLSNMKIQIQDGNFSMEMGLFNLNSRVDTDLYVTKTELESAKMENLALVTKMLTDYSEKDRIQTVALLDNYYNSVEKDRNKEMKLVTNALEHIYSDTEQRFNKTEKAMNDLVRYVNYQNK